MRETDRPKPPSEAEKREARLAAQLRANLRRRKGAPARSPSPPPDPDPAS